MKKLSFLVLTFLVALALKVAAYSSDSVNINPNGLFEDGNEIVVSINGASTLTSAQMSIGDINLNLKSIAGNSATFTIPTGSTLKMGKLSTTIIADGKTYYGPNRPLLQSVDILSKKGGEKVQVTGSFSGNCSLMLSDSQSLGISQENGQYYLTLPTTTLSQITGGYLDCDGLKSNYLAFDIKIPHLDYLVSKDKSSIGPGKTVLLKGKNFEKQSSDDFNLTFGSIQITGYTIIDNSTIQFDIPNENVKTGTLKLVKNGYESNSLSVDSYGFSNISNVSYEKNDDSYIIKIMGKFNYNLGSLQVYFGGNTLTVQETGDNYINAYFPKVDVSQIQTSTGTYYDYSNYSCDYYLTPDFLYITVGGISSNKFFTKLDVSPRVRYVDQPKCTSNSYCEIEMTVDNLLKNNEYKIKLNGQYADVLLSTNLGQNSYKVKIATTSIVEKGYIQVETDRCLASKSYYFDYSWAMKPKIFSIDSYNFKAGAIFEIIGENFTDSIGSNSSDLNISLSPDFISKDSTNNNEPHYTKGSGNIKGTLGVVIDYKTGDKVDVSLSNNYGVSNGGYFLMESGKKSYTGKPEIDYVSFPDGIYSGKKMTINGVGFSTKCTDNKVLWGDIVLIPTECTLKKLTLIVPSVSSQTVSVQIFDNKSDEYSFKSEIGGIGYSKNSFEFVSSGFSLEKDLSSDSTMEMLFSIKNTYGNIYAKNLSFILSGADYLPASDFTLNVGDDQNSYSYNTINLRLVQTDLSNVGYATKLGDKQYQVTFENVYIPFSKTPMNMSIKASLDQNYMNDTKISVLVPQQIIYYQMLYNDDETLSKASSQSVSLGSVEIKGKALNCFEDSSGNGYCTALNGGNKQPEETGETSTSNESLSTGDKYTRLAENLNDDLIKKVNTKLLKIISKYYKTYYKNEYLQSMIQTYKLMLKTKDKVEYSKLLYQYVREYKKLKISLK